MDEVEQLVSGLKNWPTDEFPVREVLALVQAYEALRRERDVFLAMMQRIANGLGVTHAEVRAYAASAVNEAAKAREGE